MTQDSPLSILHWNSRSLIPKFNELKLLNEKHHFDIIVITESWLQPRPWVHKSGTLCHFSVT